jgi:predicted enzyme related to lactoylglutathione lyase
MATRRPALAGLQGPPEGGPHIGCLGHTLLTRSVIVVGRETPQMGGQMKIKLTSVYVDDQERALRFYTEVLGFVKKADFSQGPFRWLTVASPEDSDGTELQLALNNNPAAKDYQQAMLQQGQPAAMFFTDDVQADYERMKARGANFTLPPKDVTGSKIAMLNDTCGNLIQITQLMRWQGV